ncbi:MAG: FeoA family protein [Pseudomonadota bacterium]
MTSTLWDLPAGGSARLTGFSDTLDESYRQRLGELGFTAGVRVHCVNRPALGAPRLYRVHASAFSLEDTIARHMLVDTLDPTA